MRRVAIVFALAAIACQDGAEPVHPQGESIPASVNHPPQPGATDAEPRADVKADVVMKGNERELVFVASAPPPFVLKDTTPFTVSLHSDPEVKFAKAKLSREDFVDPKTPDKTVTTKITAPPGDHTITIDAELYVCSAELCKQVQQQLTAQFTVPPKT